MDYQSTNFNPYKSLEINQAVIEASAFIQKCRHLITQTTNLQSDQHSNHLAFTTLHHTPQSKNITKVKPKLLKNNQSSSNPYKPSMQSTVIKRVNQSYMSLQKSLSKQHFKSTYQRSKQRTQQEQYSIIPSVHYFNTHQSFKDDYHQQKHKQKSYHLKKQQKLKQSLNSININKPHHNKKSILSKNVKKSISREKNDGVRKNAIKNMKKYKFVEKYISDKQLDFLLNRYILAKLPQEKWPILIIDEVYKKMKYNSYF